MDFLAIRKVYRVARAWLVELKVRGLEVLKRALALVLVKRVLGLGLEKKDLGLVVVR